MDTKYIELFSWIETILDKQQKQKFRGLNNYNMVNVVRKATHEVGMHSNIIYSLINPNGNHFQDDLFLNIFIEKVLLKKLSLSKVEDFGTVYSVKAEEITEENRRIDFTIKSDKYLIGIEMKVNASDLKYQVSHYYGQLENESDGQTKNNVYIFYLTKFGTKASQKSLEIKSGSTTQFDPSKHLKTISFDKHILSWINSCQKEIHNITNLNVALENYKNIVKKITNQYKGNVVTIADKLLEKDTKGLKHEKELITVLKLDKEMNNIKGGILFNFFKQIDECCQVKGYANVTNTVIPYEDNKLNKDKCKKSFSKGRVPRHYGYAFDCGFSNDKYLFVKVAKTGLYYGVICKNEIKNKTKLEHFYYKNDKLNKFLNNKYEKNAEHIGDIGKLDNLLINTDKEIDEMFENIKKIKNII